MRFRFAVVGDSLAQGFHNGAVRETEWSFPAILARSLGLRVGSDRSAEFRVPSIPGVGLPINLVSALDAMRSATGDDVEGLEWLCKTVPALVRHLSQADDYYERGVGAKPLEFDGVFHNLGMYGLTTHESYTLTAEQCDQTVRDQEGRFFRNLVPFPTAHQQRAARLVLNPARSPHRNRLTQLENLELLVRGSQALGIEPEPLDALIVWLGSNDCLKTVVQMELRDMPAASARTDAAGRRYNLTSKEHFDRDFDAVAERIDRILAGSRTRVYVGNVPDVTIPPLAKGFGVRDATTGLYQKYGRFFLDQRAPLSLCKTLSYAEALVIKTRIAAYNATIEKVCAKREWTLVDTAGVLDLLAVRRNAPAQLAQADPRLARRDKDLRSSLDALAKERLERYCDRIGVDEHPLQELKPAPSVLMFESNAASKRTQGGLTSLDGVHPSTVGYGIAAEGFLKHLRADFPSLGHTRVPWPDVIHADHVLRHAPRVWDDVFSLMSAAQVPSDWVFRVLPLG